jgi:hypothetical protein
MGKAKVRLSAFDPTVITDTKRTAIGSKGSVASRTWDQAASAGRPTHKGLGSNSKLKGNITSLNFDGANDSLSLSSAENMGYGEKWFWVFAFVDLDTSADRVLAYSSDAGGYIGIASGGTGIIYRPNASKGSESTIATNNTNNSSISYTFGNDVEVLIMSRSASSNTLNFYNIDGDLIAQETPAGAGSGWNLDTIGIRDSFNDPFEGQLLDARFYNHNECPPVTSASLQAIGNRYKLLKD